MFAVKKHQGDLNGVAEAIKKLDGILIEKQMQSIGNEKLEEVLSAINISKWYTDEINTDTLRKWLIDFEGNHVFDLVIGIKHILNESSSPSCYFLSNLLFSALVNADTIERKVILYFC